MGYSEDSLCDILNDKHCEFGCVWEWGTSTLRQGVGVAPLAGAHFGCDSEVSLMLFQCETDTFWAATAVALSAHIKTNP